MLGYTSGPPGNLLIIYPLKDSRVYIYLTVIIQIIGMWPDLLVPIILTAWYPTDNISDQCRAKNAEMVILKNILFSIRTFSFSFFFGIFLGFCLAVFSVCKLQDPWINLYHLFLAKLPDSFWVHSTHKRDQRVKEKRTPTTNACMLESTIDKLPKSLWYWGTHMRITASLNFKKTYCTQQNMSRNYEISLGS